MLTRNTRGDEPIQLNSKVKLAQKYVSDTHTKSTKKDEETKKSEYVSN